MILLYITERTTSQYRYSKIFPQQDPESFHRSVREHLLSELSGLVPSSVLIVKKLIKTGLQDKNDPDAVNLRESIEQSARLQSGIPGKRFRMIAAKEIRHKL